MTDEGGVIPRKLLGHELRRLRENKRQTLEEVANTLLISTSKLSRLENGQGLPQLRDVRDLQRHFGIVGTPLAEQLESWVSESRAKPWWQEITSISDLHGQYYSFESAAAEIHAFAARWIPSLVQNGSYSRNLIEAVYTPVPSNVDEHVEVRLRRQAIWQRPDRPAKIDIVVDESALFRQVGSPQVMACQLRHAAQLARERPATVTLRILKLSRGPHWASREGTFTVFSFRDRVHPDIAYPDYSDKYSSDADSVHRYLDRFDALADISLSPEESVEHLLRVARDRFDSPEGTGS